MEFNLFTLHEPAGNQIIVDVELNSVFVKMKQDTSASLSVRSATTFQDLKQQGQVGALQASTAKLESDAIPVLGCVDLQARHGNMGHHLCQI